MVPLSTFFGRAAEQARLLRLLETSPLLTVTGPAGIGKSRLVTEALARFADGPTGGNEVVRCDLATLPAGTGAAAVSAEAGFESPDAVALSLAQRRGVLVLDSCEHVLAAVSDLAVAVVAAGEAVRVVATSREPLGVDGEQVLVLGPLAVPAGEVDVEGSPAVQLFLDRAASAGASWPRSPAVMASVARLCRELDGLPLAIELAAARSRALSPDDLLGHMARRLDLLRAPGRGRVGTARHDSLRAAIDVSVALVAFVAFAPVAWSAVAVMAPASLAGGFAGAKVARLVPPGALRIGIVVVGVAVGVVLLVG